MAVIRFGDWNKVRVLLSAGPRLLHEASQKALRQEAQFLRTKIVEGITKQAPGDQPFKPLSPYTLAVRRFLGFSGSKALIERGDLRGSIKTREFSTGIMVGVLRGTKASDGRELVNIAAVHEFGSKPIIIRMTPKMRAFLMAALRAKARAINKAERKKYGVSTSVLRTMRKLEAQTRESQGRKGFIVVQIPPRPFLRPVFEKYGGPALKRRFEERMRKLLLGSFAR